MNYIEFFIQMFMLLFPMLTLGGVILFFVLIFTKDKDLENWFLKNYKSNNKQINYEVFHNPVDDITYIWEKK